RGHGTQSRHLASARPQAAIPRGPQSMSKTEPATKIPAWRIQPLQAGILSYLVPGLGQILQGRTLKGVMFMVLLLGTFFAGQAIGGWRNVYIPRADNTWRLPPPLDNVVA